MMGLELVKTAAGGGGDKPGQWRGPLVSIMCPGHCAAKPLCQPGKHDIDWERLHRGRQVASRSYFYCKLCMMLMYLKIKYVSYFFLISSSPYILFNIVVCEADLQVLMLLVRLSVAVLKIKD